MASTPTRPAAKSRTIDTASPTTTGTTAAIQTICATAGAPMDCASRPPANPATAMVTSDQRRMRSTASAMFRLSVSSS